MYYSRLFAGFSFLSFALALAGTLLLARGRARQPELKLGALRAAVRLNPRDSGAWMALGLAAEQEGDVAQAANCFLSAEKVDRQYLPAWTSANFFFRRANDRQFWRAAARAAAMSYDDPAPLIELADHRESNAIAALERLGDSAHLERGYLRFLIEQSRWQEAGTVAARLSLRDEARDRELLLNLIDHLIEANQAEGALAAWNGLRYFPSLERASRGTLSNQDFSRQPSGQGFDWRITEPPRGSVRWGLGKIRFWLADSTPDACRLLDQWVVLDPGRYLLRLQYRTEGLAEETGLRWTLLNHGREESSSAVLGQTPRRGSNPIAAEWNFRIAKAGLYELAWIYRRVPGTTHQEGSAELFFAHLGAL